MSGMFGSVLGRGLLYFAAILRLVDESKLWSRCAHKDLPESYFCRIISQLRQDSLVCVDGSHADRYATESGVTGDSV